MQRNIISLSYLNPFQPGIHQNALHNMEVSIGVTCYMLTHPTPFGNKNCNSFENPSISLGILVYDTIYDIPCSGKGVSSCILHHHKLAS
jgi:hypothetical protein